MTPQIRCIIDIKIRPRRLLIDPIFHWGGQWTITITNIKQKYNFEIIFLPPSSNLNWITCQDHLYSKTGVEEGDFNFSVNVANSGQIVKIASIEISKMVLFCITIGHRMIHVTFC